MCGREMDKPAVTVGAMPIGPKCARRAGLLKTNPRAVRRAKVEEDTETGDLFAETDSNNSLDGVNSGA